MTCYSVLYLSDIFFRYWHVLVKPEDSINDKEKSVSVLKNVIWTKLRTGNFSETYGENYHRFAVGNLPDLKNMIQNIKILFDRLIETGPN